MIDLCEDCGARLEMDEDGQFFCPIQRANMEASRADFGRQVELYQLRPGLGEVMAGQGLPTINAEDKP